MTADTAAQHDSGDGPVRRDLEGLRAVAIGSLLAAHAGVPFLAGGFVGVDVFFVLAGFLTTGLLVREMSRPSAAGLASFWVGRARRIAPAGAVVLVFSAVVTFVYLPVEKHREIAGDIVASALQVVNWRLADSGASRLADADGQSPVQHLWSVAVGVQVLLLLSVVMVVIGLAAGRRWRPVAAAAVGLGLGLGSFAWSLRQVSDDAGVAFFTSTARAWEIGVGALLALGATQLVRMPAVVRAVGGWVGLALVTYAVLFFDESTTWPGAAALVPTVGAALVIAGGLDGAAKGSPQQLLSLPPLVWIGGLAFGLYLWHWPILVAVEAERPEMRLRFVVVLMLLTIVPAYLTRRLVEDPISAGRLRRSPLVATGLVAVVTAAGVVAGLVLSSTVSTGEVVDRAPSSGALGAAALLDPADRYVVWSEVKAVDSMRPLPADAPQDRPPVYDERPQCQLRGGESDPQQCETGDILADRVVVLVGDSKVVQWITPIETIAEAQGWKVVQMTKSACPFTDAGNGRSNEPDCREWGRKAVKEIIDLDPDLVITSQRRGNAEDASGRLTREGMVDGLVSYWTQIRQAGIPMSVILDNPQPADQPVFECVERNTQDLTRCSFDLAEGVEGSGAGAQAAAAERVPGVGVVDLTDVICPDDGRCPAVIGNVLLYRLGSHITMTFADTALPQLSDRLHAATNGLFGDEL